MTKTKSLWGSPLPRIEALPLKEEISMADALEIWENTLSAMADNNGVHPEGIYYPFNVRKELLANWGDQLADRLYSADIQSPYSH